jgi:predicted nucleic acid-binding protein
VLLDTNVVVRHLTGQPAGQARRATAFLREAGHLDLPDLIVAELVYVLESVYERPRPEVAALVRSVLAFPPVQTSDELLLLRAVELYETRRVDFAEAYLAALAERGDRQVASFDRGLDRVPTIERVEPN